ncbi:MAG TPA: hypothetical protein VFV55_02640 [Usitatibacteraceae bacterium]|nr:hypothetical protein [Usitatibacteraceae bacterium]
MEERNATEPKRGNFLSEGFRELGRKIDRAKLRSLMRKQETDRAAALVALGQRAWEEKIDLSAFAELRDRLTGLDARAGELSATASKLDAEKSTLETERRAELEKFAARRKAVEEKKSPIDAALRTSRSAKTAIEQAIKQSESRLAAIAGKLSTLDRDIAAFGTAAAPGQGPKLAAAQAERAKLAAEQVDLGARMAKAREDLPAHVTEESRLSGESQKYAAEIAVIDAEQKASIAHIDENLARVRKESQGASQQASAVQKDRSGNLGSLGQALYEAKVAAPQLAEPAGRVAAIDRARAEAQSTLDASTAESQLLSGATMATFWSVLVGVPLLLAALGVGTWQFLHRRAAPAPVAIQATTVPGKGCTYQQPPDSGEGVSISSDCTRTEGTFVEGRLHGKGRKAWPNGELMEGQFYSGSLYGPGLHVTRDGRRIEAAFSGGRPIGPGKLTMPDGTVFEGRFWGPAIVGWGVRRSPNGEVLAGDWREAPGGGMKPFGLMLRVRPDGTREKVEAAALDPASAPSAAPATQAQPVSDDKLY